MEGPESDQQRSKRQGPWEALRLPPQSSAQERPSKPKRRLLDFDESDESIEEEDELEAELSRLLIAKSVFCLQVQERTSFG